MAARTGKNLVKTGQEWSEKMADGVYTAPANDEGVQGGAKAVQFQRKFAARDRYDDEMNMKMQLMDEDGMTPFGQVYYDDKVGRWLERKEAASEAANFDSYFNQNFNKNDLASRQWAQQIHPEFYDAREREMNERAELVVKLKKIQLRGPQNEEDLKMLYLIENGRVVLPDDWDKIGTGFEDTTYTREERQKNENVFRRGLIRMPLFLSDKQQRRQATQNNSVGAWGNSNTKNAFYAGNPVSLTQNQPLSTRAGGPTLGFNFQKWLGSNN